LIDEGERDRMKEPGLRGVIEVVRSRVSVSFAGSQSQEVADVLFRRVGNGLRMRL
jgi:hypothetical protein